MPGRTVADRTWGSYARLVVALRVVLVVAWIAAAVAAAVFLPGLSSSSTAPIGDLVPPGARALSTEERALQLFGSVVASDTMVVRRDPAGLDAAAIAGLADTAAQVDDGTPPRALTGIRAAVPLVNVPIPGTEWRERTTTAITYLFLDPGLNLDERRDAADAYAQALPAPAPGTSSGVTGSAPARVAQFNAIDDKLPWIEGATVALILVIVAVAFRSLWAPLVTLFTAAIAYVCAVHGLAWFGEQLGRQPPSEIEPVLVVLLLGLVTDYTVFFMSEARRRVAAGDDRLPAAREATVRIAPIVLVAGLLVAAGAASLLAGRMDFFQVFGPGLALCALVVTVVAVTLVPALLALVGPRLFGRHADRRPREPGRLRRGSARFLTARPVAIVIGLVCIAALVLGAAGARKAELGVSFIPSLPESSQVRQAAGEAAQGFTPGILGPTDLVVEQPDLASQRPALARLQGLLAREPGVAAVLGPGEPLPAPADRFLVAQSGDAARFVLVLDEEPTGAPAIHTLRALEERVPALARQAGLPAGASLAYGGETALASETVDAMVHDLWRVGAATAIIMFVLLALFLRALVAPVLLLIGAVLAFAGSFGLTALLLPGTIGGHELTYYVPLVAAVLLVGLGSDYNVYVVGRIREEARDRPLRAAIAAAVPSASRAVTIAGLTLAATFALLAIIPLRPFRELAMLMTIGVLIDALFVRPVLVPALIAAVGPKVWWPGRLAAPQGTQDPAADVAEALRPPA